MTTWVSHLPDFYPLDARYFGHWDTDRWSIDNGTEFTFNTYDGETWFPWVIGYRPTQIKVVMDISATEETFLVYPYIQTYDQVLVTGSYSATPGINEFIWTIDWGISTYDIQYFDIWSDIASTSLSITEIAFTEDAPSPENPAGTAEIGFECTAVGVTITADAYSRCTIEVVCLAHGVALKTLSADGMAVIGFDLTAHIVRHSAGTSELTTQLSATGSANPPTMSKEVLNTRYLLTLQGSKAFTVDRTASWEVTPHGGYPEGWYGVWNGSYWARSLQDSQMSLEVSGNWAVGFRPATLTVDLNVVHFGSSNWVEATFMVLLQFPSAPEIVLTSGYALGRQTITFSLPSFTEDTVRIVFALTFLDVESYIEIHGIAFTYVGMGEEEYLPMSNFSVSSRSGSPSAINATVPYTPQAMATVTGYQSGTLRLYREQTYTDGETDTALVEIGSLTHLQLDQGPINASIVLTGQATRTNTSPKYVVLHGLSYYASVDGKQRIRCAPFNGLNVGDTVKAGNHTLVANNIQLSVSVTQELMEVYE